MADATETTFADMASAFPVRTGLYTLGPLLFAVAQLANTYLHGGPVLFTAVFAVAILAFAVQLNRYYLAAYRRTTLVEEWI